MQTAQKVWSEVAPLFSEVITVLDLGCGMGAWSAVVESDESKSVQLVDHPSVPKSNLLVKNKDNFLGIDLDKELPPSARWDLIICIEVLEHFSTKRALELKDFIISCTDLVLFSAAIPGQGGVGHINCQRHSYWHHQFKQAGFKYYDGFKSAIVHDESIPFWIRQNLFIYYTAKYDFIFADKPNYTPANFELIHAGMLRNEIGLKSWLNMGPAVWLNFIRRLFKIRPDK